VRRIGDACNAVLEELVSTRSKARVQWDAVERELLILSRDFTNAGKTLRMLACALHEEADLDRERGGGKRELVEVDEQGDLFN